MLVYQTTDGALAKHIVEVSEYWGYPISYETEGFMYNIMADEPISELTASASWVGGIAESYMYLQYKFQGNLNEKC